MIIDEKIVNLIVKLNKLTSQGMITWEVEDPPRTIVRGTDDHIPLFMVTRYKGQRFALYQHRYQSFSMEFEQLFWNERITLAILDNEDRVLWEEREQSSALYDLFETTRRKVSDIDSLIDDLLSDDEELDRPSPK